MIGVTVTINETVLYHRSAVNTGVKNKKGEHIYKVDDGEVIAHIREAGAIPLVIEMLKGIKEP